MITLFLIAAAPVFIILAYIYYRDRYEKESLNLLLEGLVAGGVICLPIIYFEQMLAQVGEPLMDIQWAAWNAFMVASLVEELFKMLAVLILVWRNVNFNEKFDGIVYAVFVSLGFALVENVLYVVTRDGGIHVGLMRAITAVPAHAMFGVMMGYWIGKARFVKANRLKYLFLAFFFPFLFHGLYDFILMSQKAYLMTFFIPLIIYMVFRSRRRLGSHQEKSVFNPSNGKQTP